MTKKLKPLFQAGQDWTFELLEKTWIEIEKIAKEELRLDYYKPQIEVISAEQMIDAYASVGLPIMYKHWSFGKEFLQNNKAYQTGQMGLAYEIVINSEPCIAYLMEENNMTMQALVMAHASAGHSAVFKCNTMFKQNTDASAIVDYLVFAKKYIAKCEEKYGEEEVELFLDSCHALQNYGVDRYKRPAKISARDEEKRALERFEQARVDYNDVWAKTTNFGAKKGEEEAEAKWPKEREDNLLYFIEKYAPDLPSWKRELIRIVRKLAQYFYPQGLTKVLNEGFATFTHYYIMTRLYEKGLITEGSYLEFLQSHTNVVYQPTFDKRYFSGMNPYALGFAMFMDIKRICENPTEEDKRWMPHLIGRDWVEATQDAMMNYKDESFIHQFLSPKVMRDFKFFSIKDDDFEDFVEISAIHNDDGYIKIRNALADSYNRANFIPSLEVDEVNIHGDRAMYIIHTPYQGRTLDPDSANKTVKHLARLWEYDVVVESPSYLDEDQVEYIGQGPKTPKDELDF